MNTLYRFIFSLGTIRCLKQQIPSKQLSCRNNLFPILMSKQRNIMDFIKRPQSSGGEKNTSDKKPVTKTKKEEFEFFYGPKNTFSQFHTAYFKVDGKKYSCMEQYMHHQKAVIFKDNERALSIMTTSEPKQHKKFGRQVQNFDKVVWGRKSVEVVRKGNLEKYRQNPEMKKTLFDTYPKTLVEAAPRDRLWGIGMGKNNPKAMNRATWRGKNLLGETLTEVRNILMKEEGCMPESTEGSSLKTADLPTSTSAGNSLKHEEKPKTQSKEKTTNSPKKSQSSSQSKEAVSSSKAERHSSPSKDKKSLSSSKTTDSSTPTKAEKSSSKDETSSRSSKTTDSSTPTKADKSSSKDKTSSSSSKTTDSSTPTKAEKSSSKDKTSSSSSKTTDSSTPTKAEKSSSKEDRSTSSNKRQPTSSDGEKTPTKDFSSTPSKKRKLPPSDGETTPRKDDRSTPSKKRKSTTATEDAGSSSPSKKPKISTPSKTE